MSAASVPFASAVEPGPPPLDWMLTMLQQAMEAVMASDATPLQKANTLARLGSLYLKAAGASELRQANKELTRRIKALEERLAAREQVWEAAAAPIPDPSTGSSRGALSPLGSRGVGAASPFIAPSEVERWPALDHDDGEENVSGYAGVTSPGNSRASP